MNGQVMFDGACLPEDVPDNNIILTDSKVRASFYHKSIVENISAAQHSLFQVCCYLYRMQDEKLYHILGFEDFKDYCTNCLHFSYSQAVKFSAVGRFVSNSSAVPVQLDEEYIQDLGVTKLYELSKLQSDELQLLFDDYDVPDLSRKELKQGIDTVKAFKKARDSSGFTDSLAEFKKVVLDTVEASDNLAGTQSEESREEHDPVLDERFQTMVSLLMSLETAVMRVDQYYEKNAKFFSGENLLSSPSMFSRLLRHIRSDLLFCELGGDVDE